jgi:hypothetical protein
MDTDIISDTDLVGYAVPLLTQTGLFVWCKNCQTNQLQQELAHNYVSLYRGNIFPYGQKCHMCHSVMVEPQSPNEFQLYPNSIPPLPEVKSITHD